MVIAVVMDDCGRTPRGSTGVVARLAGPRIRCGARAVNRASAARGSGRRGGRPGRGSGCCAALKALPAHPSYPSIVWVGRVFAPKPFEEHDDARKESPSRSGGRAFQSWPSCSCGDRARCSGGLEHRARHVHSVRTSRRNALGAGRSARSSTGRLIVCADNGVELLNRLPFMGLAAA